MQLQNDLSQTERTEFEVCQALLPLAQAALLELGCGRADATRQIALAYPGAKITAMEVDLVQHSLNLAQTDLPNVRFSMGGAQAIPCEDGGFDAVMMFKSLHHVPVAAMGQALSEIHRVLRPDGLALFSEPVFAGEYNEVLRIFHNEQEVRMEAFAALRRAVHIGRFELVTQTFFQRRVQFGSFADFEKAVIGVTHTQHRLSQQQFAAVRERFQRSVTPNGAVFLQPMRVDLLRRHHSL
jgi:ubiquinone/menaquinone biosynthesis C-methylase UbiE